jgi:hypothetical protein
MSMDSLTDSLEMVAHSELVAVVEGRERLILALGPLIRVEDIILTFFCLVVKEREAFLLIQNVGMVRSVGMPGGKG